MGLPDTTVLQVLKPLYGIPQSGLHWYLAYVEHHLEHFGMERIRADPCIIIRRCNDKIEGFRVRQVDGSLGVGTMDCLNDEEEHSHNLKWKQRKQITPHGMDQTFNGKKIRLQ